MAAEGTTQREMQEKSIKARKNELFVNGEVDPPAEPRQTFHQCLKETPAAPLSKNVKLMLWGSAAPVVLLFLGSLLAVNKSSSSQAKAPEGLIVPDRAKQAATAAAKTEIARQSDAPATKRKPEEPKPKAAAKTENPPEEKPKPKNNKDKDKGKGKDKAKPKTDDASIAKTDDASKGEDPSKTAESKANPNPKPNPNPDASTSKPETTSTSKPESTKPETTAGNDESRN